MGIDKDKEDETDKQDVFIMLSCKILCILFILVNTQFKNSLRSLRFPLCVLCGESPTDRICGWREGGRERLPL
jgi:hypothetical protein